MYQHIILTSKISIALNLKTGKKSPKSMWLTANISSDLKHATIPSCDVPYEG